ncbi:hypothetical protein ACFWGN_03105 [Oerskovia sp. NPDC060338]
MTEASFRATPHTGVRRTVHRTSRTATTAAATVGAPLALSVVAR